MEHPQSRPLENANTHYGRIRIKDGKRVVELVPFRNIRVSLRQEREVIRNA